MEHFRAEISKVKCRCRMEIVLEYIRYCGILVINCDR